MLCHVYNYITAFVLSQERLHDCTQKSAHLPTSQAALHASAYFQLILYHEKRLGVFLLPMDGMLVHHKVTHQH